MEVLHTINDIERLLEGIPDATEKINSVVELLEKRYPHAGAAYRRKVAREIVSLLFKPQKT